MFERYTERARRAIFFSRYECSMYGSTTIEPEHLLLGLLREDGNLVSRFAGAAVSAATVQNDVVRAIPVAEKISISVDLPLSNQSRHVLARAAEEAEKLKHRHVGTEHLLLGILGEEKSVAAAVLTRHGIKLQDVRHKLAESPSSEPETGAAGFMSALMGRIRHRDPNFPAAGVAADAETAQQIAESVWQDMYGSETVAGQKPFSAELKFNVWIVTGSPTPSKLFIFILQEDGRVLSVGKWMGNSEAAR
jgi:ATP-dependent Clp protease ATP-binding subunit ClpA